MVTYFIVGALVMYFARGARGIEVIPNVSFWGDLPFLLKVSGLQWYYDPTLLMVMFANMQYLEPHNYNVCHKRFWMPK